LREEINAFEVDVQQLVECFLGGLINGRVAVYAGVVDQEVEVFSLPLPGSKKACGLLQRLIGQPSPTNSI
jgi:hypothetical protein